MGEGPQEQLQLDTGERGEVAGWVRGHKTSHDAGEAI